MSDTDTRSVAEIMWTSEPCCNVEDNNGHCADDCRIWTSPDGLRREYGSTLNVEVTPDEMLAWLRSRGYRSDIQGALESDPVEMFSVMPWNDDDDYPDAFTAPTLHAALEAAVRAVAEAERCAAT